MQVFIRVFGYMRAYWKSILIAYLCMLLITGARLISPMLIRQIVDDMTTGFFMGFAKTPGSAK